MLNILLIDQDKQVKTEFASIFKTVMPDCEVFEFSSYREAGQRAENLIKRWVNDEAVAMEEELPNFNLRLRHGGDFTSGTELPRAAFEVCYGGIGYKDDRVRDGEEPFYYPLKFFVEKTEDSSTDTNQSWCFTVDDARQLIDFAQGNSAGLPSCFHPNLYEEGLERKLRTLYQNTKVDWSRFHWPRLQEQWRSKFGSTEGEQLGLLFGQIKQPANLLLLWNDSNDTDSVIPPQNATVCKSADDFSQIAIQKYDVIIVCAELNWHTNYLTALSGIDYVTSLRKNDYRGVIIVASFYEWHDIERRIKISKPKFGVLNTPYTWFYHLGKTEKKENQKYDRIPSARMSNTLIWDIKFYVLDALGVLHSAYHALKGRMARKIEPLRSLLEEREVIKVIANDFFVEILPPLVAPQHTHRLEIIHQEFLKQLGKYQHDQPYYDLIQSSFSTVKRYIPTLNDVFTTDAANHRPWGVIYVDDYEDRRNKVQWLLQEAGITCFAAATGEEVFHLLEQDKQGELKKGPGEGLYEKNFVKVLIADYRLLHESGRWQTLQGYQIIQQVAERNDNFLSFAILTDKRGIILRHARRAAKVQVAWFSKELLLEANSQRYLINEIIELGDRANKSNMALSNNEVWNNGKPPRTRVPLKRWYRHYCSLAKYEAYEDIINFITFHYLELVDSLLYDKINLDGPSQKTLHLRAKIEDNFVGISKKFNARFKKTPEEDPSEIKLFLNRLLARRVIIALVKFKSKTIETIAIKTDKKVNVIIEIVLLHLSLDTDKDKFNNALFNYHFALPIKDWKTKSAWLPEEKYFCELYSP